MRNQMKESDSLRTLELNAFKKNVKLLLSKPKEWQSKLERITVWLRDFKQFALSKYITDSVELSNC